jgi:hypothetical protein
MELASKHNVQPRSITHRHSLGERYPQQWHGIGLNNATSNLAEPLTAMSSSNSNNNKRTTQITYKAPKRKFYEKSEVKIRQVRFVEDFVGLPTLTTMTHSLYGRFHPYAKPVDR